MISDYFSLVLKSWNDEVPCASLATDVYFLWSWHSLVSASPPAGDWDCHALDPTVWHVSLSEAGRENHVCWLGAKFTPLTRSPYTFPHFAASGNMAAVQRGRPPDRTHHVKQEVGHAPRGRLPPWTEGKQGVWRTLLVLKVPEGENRINIRKDWRRHSLCSVPFVLLVCRWLEGRWQRRGDLGPLSPKSRKAVWQMLWDTCEQVQIQMLSYYMGVVLWPRQTSLV